MGNISLSFIETSQQESPCPTRSGQPCAAQDPVPGWELGWDPRACVQQETSPQLSGGTSVVTVLKGTLPTDSNTKVTRQQQTHPWGTESPTQRSSQSEPGAACVASLCPSSRRRILVCGGPHHIPGQGRDLQPRGVQCSPVGLMGLHSCHPHLAVPCTGGREGMGQRQAATGRSRNPVEPEEQGLDQLHQPP